jgi:hypothetical protein
MAIILPITVTEGNISFNRIYNNGNPYWVYIHSNKGIMYQNLENEPSTGYSDGWADMIGFDNYAEYAAHKFLALNSRSTNYFSFREQDLAVQIPEQMYLLRQKLNVVGNPTMGDLFESIDPQVLTYIKKYNSTNYVIVPISFSAKRVVVGTGEAAYPSSEIEELNQLASAQAQFESGGVYKTFPAPGSTIFTYDELLAFNWDIV